jgi:hypothetical protein
MVALINSSMEPCPRTLSIASTSSARGPRCLGRKVSSGVKTDVEGGWNDSDGVWGWGWVAVVDDEMLDVGWGLYRGRLVDSGRIDRQGSAVLLLNRNTLGRRDKDMMSCPTGLQLAMRDGGGER